MYRREDFVVRSFFGSCSLSYICTFSKKTTVTMPSYGAVPQSDSASSDGERKCDSFLPKGLTSFLEGGNDAAASGVQRETPTQRVVDSSKLEFFVNAERIRFIAYLSFWGMCFFAIAMTKMVVRDLLLKGPEEDGNTCPPFQISYKEDGSVLRDKSGGFDILTDSHLQDAFGFGNVSKIRLRWLPC
jgi:hypothetical protein